MGHLSKKHLNMLEKCEISFIGCTSVCNTCHINKKDYLLTYIVVVTCTDIDDYCCHDDSIIILMSRTDWITM